MSHPLRTKVEEIVKGSPVVIFMKGTPDEPACGFSARACDVLRAAGAGEVKGIDILSDDPLWEALEDYTQHFTVPQIFIKGEFIGGSDIAMKLYEKGELQKMIQG